MTNTSSLNYFVNNGKYPAFIDLVILNLTITVILTEKFNPTIMLYLVPRGMTIKNDCCYCFSSHVNLDKKGPQNEKKSQNLNPQPPVRRPGTLPIELHGSQLPTPICLYLICSSI